MSSLLRSHQTGRVDISAHPPRLTPLVIGSDLTCGSYEDVYAGLEWDIVNVSLPTMTLNHPAVNLSLDTEKYDQIRIEGPQ
jgi:hypothetical protein